MLISAGAVIDLVQSHFAGVAKKRDTQQLTLRYLGLVLFETRRNIDQVLELVSAADRYGEDPHTDPPSALYGSLNFDVSAASFGDVCRFLPVPSAIAMLQGIIAELKQLDLQQRMVLDDLPVAVGASALTAIGHEAAGLARVAVVARRFLARERPKQFNELREIAFDLLRAAWGDEEYQAMEAELLPMPLDLPQPAPPPTEPPQSAGSSSTTPMP